MEKKYDKFRPYTNEMYAEWNKMSDFLAGKEANKCQVTCGPNKHFYESSEKSLKMFRRFERKENTRKWESVKKKQVAEKVYSR